MHNNNNIIIITRTLPDINARAICNVCFAINCAIRNNYTTFGIELLFEHVSTNLRTQNTVSIVHSVAQITNVPTRNTIGFMLETYTPADNASCCLHAMRVICWFKVEATMPDVWLNGNASV